MVVGGRRPPRAGRELLRESVSLAINDADIDRLICRSSMSARRGEGRKLLWAQSD